MRKNLLFIFIWLLSLNVSAQKDSLFFTTKEITRVAINTDYNYHFEAYDSADDFVFCAVSKFETGLTWNSNGQSLSGKMHKAGQSPIDIIAFTKRDTIHQQFMLTVYDKNTTNILCLGNSITNGVDTFNSYRRDLWQLLHAANYNFDFIGSWSKHHMGSNVPVPDFDMDNEGHSGWNFRDILHPPKWDDKRGSLYEWIKTYKPDIVLLELGTNDVFQCRKTKDMLADLTEIIKILRTKNNHVKIFVAQIPSLGNKWADKKLCGVSKTYAEAIIELNKQIPVYAKQYSTVQSPIIVVDQYTGFDASTDTFDDIHPNTKGEKVMAEKWFIAIKPYLKQIAF